MGRKIPMWQCILVMVVMIVLIFWNVMIDTDAGEDVYKRQTHGRPATGHRQACRRCAGR